MKKNPLTSSERRGVIVVAALALFITGIGLIFRQCDSKDDDISPADREILVDGDSLNNAAKESAEVNGKRARRKRRNRSDSVSGKRERVVTAPRRRNFLDERLFDDIGRR